jgi:hypothetical protein
MDVPRGTSSMPICLIMPFISSKSSLFSKKPQNVPRGTSLLGSVSKAGINLLGSRSSMAGIVCNTGCMESSENEWTSDSNRT